MVYANILAGGKGVRFGNADMPKQFLSLGSKPIFIHTLEQFVINKSINKIIVCCPKEWMEYANDIIKKYLSDASNIDVIEGGETRNKTILCACDFIDKTYGINKDDIIITHDAVRPFITQRIIDDNIKAGQEYGATDTVVPAFDTIVESKDGQVISNIPIRSYMYQGQTPQTFRVKELKDMINSLTEEESNILTDTCKIYLLRNKEVHLVIGESYNLKITTPHDLKIANAILDERTNHD